MSVSLIVGIDMAKKSFTAAYRIGEAGYDLGDFANTPTGYDALHHRLNHVCETQGMQQIHLIVESTGGYEAALLAYGYGQGWAISMPNARRVRCWAEGVNYRAKTDRIDARILAHYGTDCRPPLRPQLAVEVSEMDSLLKRRLDLEQAHQKEQTRLSELANRPGISPKVHESLQQVIDALRDALAEIEQAIAELQQRHQSFQAEAQRLLSLPGVGPKVLWPLVVKLMQFHNLTSGQGDASAFVAFIGLDPQPHVSGSSVHKHPGISKMGDSELRRLLYMGALGAISGDNPLRTFYRRLIDRGKAKKVALVAAARKLLVWAWTLFSRQTQWNPHFHHMGD